MIAGGQEEEETKESLSSQGIQLQPSIDDESLPTEVAITVEEMNESPKISPLSHKKKDKSIKPSHRAK